MRRYPTHDDLIAVIGRGNSGTRVLAQALYAGGVFLGERLNDSGDTVPPEEMYRACRAVGRHVRWCGDCRWDFDPLHTGEVDTEFAEHAMAYLEPLLATEKRPRGWKLPETTLAFPWIVRLLPEAKYIHLIRDPRDCLLGSHLTDDIRRWHAPGPESDDVFERRVASWKYQHEIVKATPTPRQFFALRFEDLVLDHEATMQRLEGFLGIPLGRVVVDETKVGRWKKDGRLLPYLEPLVEDMRELGYE